MAKDVKEEKDKKKDKPKDKGTQHPGSKPMKKLEGVRMIVRFAEADLYGTKKVANALLRVRGVGPTLARAIVQVSGINPKEMVGKLSDEELKKLEEITLNPLNYGIPTYMVNRQKDPETGENAHKLSSELIFTKKSDIDNMKKIQVYRGVRHQLGLPVRGQRTRSSFRTGARVGVVKKKEQPKSGGKK